MALVALEPVMTVASPRPVVIRRILAGIGSSTLSQILGSVQTIVLVPLFIRAWGENGYGQWLTLVAAASYLSLLDLGGQTYTANVLAMHSARGELEAFRRRLAEAVSVFTVLSIGVLVVVALALTAALWYDVPGLGRPLQRGEAVVLALLACSYLLGVPGGVYGTVYRATGEFARGAMIGNLVRIAWLAATVVLLLVAVDQTTYAAAFVLSTITGMAAIIADTRWRLPACRQLPFSRINAWAGWRDLRHAVHFWIISIVQTGIQQGIVLILALFGSPAIVALYVTHRTVANVAGYVGSLLQAPIGPEISFLWAQGRRAALMEMTVIATRTVVVSTGLLVLILWTVVPIVYPIWTSQRLLFTPVLLAVLLVQAIITAAWNPTSWGLLATNHHRSVAACYVGNAVLVLAAASWLVPRYGATGAALAGLVADVILVICLPAIAARHLDVSAGRMYWEMALSLLALSPAITGTLLIILVIGGWLALVPVALIVCGSALALHKFALAGRSVDVRV